MGTNKRRLRMIYLLEVVFEGGLSWEVAGIMDVLQLSEDTAAR